MGRGGETAFFGPCDELEKYFASIGFPNKDNEAYVLLMAVRPLCSRSSISEFAMNVLMGKVSSSLDPAFQPRQLAMYWQRYSAGLAPITVAGTDCSDMIACPYVQSSSITKAEEPSTATTTVDDPFGLDEEDEHDSQSCRWFAELFRSMAQAVLQGFLWTVDVCHELWSTCRSVVDCFTCRRDSLRDVPSIAHQFYLLLKRYFMTWTR